MLRSRARASGCPHSGAATGETSEAALRAFHGLPDHALIEMGDFAGGFLKYLRARPVARVIIAGGPAPLIATALLAAFGSGYAVAAYILFCAMVSIIATALLPDYTNRDISGEGA